MSPANEIGVPSLIISRDPAVMGGTPSSPARVPVQVLVDELVAGGSIAA